MNIKKYINAYKLIREVYDSPLDILIQYISRRREVVAKLNSYKISLAPTNLYSLVLCGSIHSL